MVFLKLVHTEYQVNHKTQPFWVKVVHLVPNVQILAGHDIGAIRFTLGGIASICFKFHFQTDDQQTLRTHTQGCQGFQKIRNLLRIEKILIARLTIHPSLSKIKNHY
jgi:hypothetical protein